MKRTRKNEESILHDYLFGGNLKTESNVSNIVESSDIEIDRLETSNRLSSSLNSIDSNHKIESRTELVLKPKWEDVDDNDISIDLNETNRLKKFKMQSTSSKVSGKEFTALLKERYEQEKVLDWAQIDTKHLDDITTHDTAFLQQSNSLIDNQGDHNRWQRMLANNKVDIQRLNDVNIVEKSNEPISVVKFDRTRNIALVGGYDKYLRLFNVDGDKNDKMLGVKFQDMKITSANFVSQQDNDAKEIVVSGKKPYFYVYDIESGSVIKIPSIVGKKITSFDNMEISPGGTTIAFSGVGGYAHIISARNKSWIQDVKMNAPLKSIAYLDDTTLLTASTEAEVYVWDLRSTGKCLSKVSHDDGTSIHSVAAIPFPSESSDKSFKLAVGAESGVVSLFNGQSILNNRKVFAIEKEKTIMNLTTAVTNVAFHPSGDILAFASNEKKDQLKLLHVPTGTCFKNWPSQNTPLHIVTCVTFSPQGAYFAFGNKRGSVLLYRLKQFSNI